MSLKLQKLLAGKGLCYIRCYKTCYKRCSGSMKYMQNIRGKWVVRIVVPEELRHIIGRNELCHIGLPDNAKDREKQALKIINAYVAEIDEAREVWEALREASIPTITSAAKDHYQSELYLDDLERAGRVETSSFMKNSQDDGQRIARITPEADLCSGEVVRLI